MAFYPSLRRIERGAWIAERLLELRASLRASIPPKSTQDSLLLATWNIREFDSEKGGERLDDAYFFIAEIISCFDLVAVQEVREDLSALDRVVSILGRRQWDYIVTDVTEGTSGNGERMAFLYDTRKVTFRGIAGEIVLPKGQGIAEDLQFARSPFLVAFQAGWFKFNIATVHIYYGEDTGAKLQRRIDEIDALAKFMRKRADRAAKAAGENFILLGDFNIISPEHKTMEALTRHGFAVPPELSGAATNLGGDKHYDQIAFRTRKGELRLGRGLVPGVEGAHKAGAFPYYGIVFRDEDIGVYAEAAGIELDGEPTAGQKRSYRNWRTYQMSDHLPMWIELQIDFADDYLTRLVEANDG